MLGIIVSSTVFRFVWPERAALKMRIAIARALRGLAGLVRIPVTSPARTPEVDKAAVEELRRDLPGELNGLLRLTELAALEGPGPRGARSLSPERARRLTEAAQELYVTAAILASEAGVEEWSRLGAAARSADWDSRGAVSEQLGRVADAAEAGGLPEGLAVAAQRAQMPDSGRGGRVPLVRQLVDQADRVVTLDSAGRAWELVN